MPPTSKQRRYHLVNPDRSEFELELVTSDAVILSGHDGASGNYFAANWLPSFDRPLSIKPDAGPLNAVFLLDVSSSREPAYFNRAVMLVKRILARNPDQIKNFNILLYSSKHAWYSDQWTTNNEPARLILDQFLNTLELRGAAKLGSALKAALNSPWTQGKQLPTALFLVSEDSSSQGDASLEYLVRTVKDFPHTKIFGYNTSPRASATLNTIAKISGGASFQVHKDKEVELLAGAHREPYWEIQDIKVAGIRDLLIKGGSTHITSGQSITIAGRGKVTPKAVIEYRVAGTKGAALLRTPIRSIISSTLAPRVYGQIAVENMLSSVPGEHDVPNQFSEHFRIVSPQMSMVMLESEYDFENFGIRLVDHTAKIQKTLVSSWIAQNQYQSVSSALKEKLATGVKNTQFKTGNVSELTAELLAILNSANSSDPALAVELAINKDYFVKHRNYGDANSDPRDPVHVALDLGSVHVQNVNLGEEPTRDYFQLLAQKRYAELFYLSAALVQPNPDGRIISILASAAEHLQKPEIALAAYEMALHFSETDEYNTRVTGLKLRVFLARLLKNSRVSRSLQDYARLRLESHELKSAGPVATPHIVVDPALRESPRFWRSPKTKVKLVGAKNTGISDLLGGTLIYENKDLTTTVSVPLKTEFNHYTLACSRRWTHSPIQLRVTVVSLADTRYQLVSCPERFKFTP